MEFDVTAKFKEVNFAPASLEEEVIQNVRTILSTVKYSVPLDRRFGISAVMLDRPMPKAMAVLQAEILTAIRKYEPRCQVTKVTFLSADGDLDGWLIPSVKITLRETT